MDALFTATSAACVTGLSVYDTFIHWSYFGQGVLLVLIQCGGLGLAAFATGLTLLVRRRIGIRHLVLARESAGGSNLDVISLLRIVGTRRTMAVGKELEIRRAQQVGDDLHIATAHQLVGHQHALHTMRGGGGSLLQDVTSWKSMIYYLSIITLGVLFRKQVFLYSQGIGPVRYRVIRIILKHVLNHAGAERTE
mgnify:CR=1 FL=1